MAKKWLVVFAFLAGACLGLQAQDAKAVIDAASKALGAGGLKSIEYSGSGYDFAIGQAPNPSSPWPKFTIRPMIARSISIRRLSRSHRPLP